MSMVATFHTHFGAMRFQKALQKAGRTAGMMPVPRALSSSCGVCVRFEEPFDPATVNDDLEAVYRQTDTGFEQIYCHEE